LFLRWLRLGEGGTKPSIRRQTRLFGPPCDFARLIREGLWSVNVRGVRASGRVKSPHKGVRWRRSARRLIMIGSESYSFMAETLKPDICVIGGGPGGLAVAVATAAFGVPTVLVECHKVGGTSLNAGCVPSKALLAAARRTEAARSAKLFGIDARDAGVNFSGVRRHVHSTIAAVARTDSFEQLRGLGIRVIHAQARFKDRNTVVAGDIEIRARRFVIATGSRPTLPAIPGLDSGSCLTSESIFDLTERPEHLIIIGAGPTGVELAQGFRRLGSSVTLLEAGQPLGQDDPECAAVVLAQLEREGIVIRSRVNVVGIAHAGRAVTATIESDGAEQTVTVVICLSPPGAVHQSQILVSITREFATTSPASS
jgi:pyruvate/2-oxoglutarate dehydrogenase complex dihydrolipoamide dehydrogenase (E3) component